MKSFEKLRAAIVGYGSIGRRHAENLKKLGVDRLVVVRRPSGRNPAFVPPEGACVVASHAEAIAEGVDFAVISNPTRLHVDSARPYLAADIPILMEKPISDCAADARQLAEEASRRGLAASMAYCLRYHPAYVAAREALRAGAIGRVLYAKAWFESYLPAWHPWEDYRQSYAARKDLGGGALRTLDHEIDFLNWCLGDPQAVMGSSRRTGALDGDADDHAALLIRYAAGATATVQLSLCRRDRSRGFEFVGEQGTLRYRWEEEKLLVVGADGTSVSVLLDHRGYDLNQMYVDLMADFLEMLSGNPCGACADLQAGVRAIEVCCQAEARSFSVPEDSRGTVTQTVDPPLNRAGG
jgi:predicted dehydrogenase